VPEDKVVQAIAEAMKLPKVDLSTVETDQAAIAKLDSDSCKVNGVFPCPSRTTARPCGWRW
jgi:hypothetical protein